MKLRYRVGYGCICDGIASYPESGEVTKPACKASNVSLQKYDLESCNETSIQKVSLLVSEFPSCPVTKYLESLDKHEWSGQFSVPLESDPHAATMSDAERTQNRMECCPHEAAPSSIATNCNLEILALWRCLRLASPVTSCQVLDLMLSTSRSPPRSRVCRAWSARESLDIAVRVAQYLPTPYTT